MRINQFVARASGLSRRNADLAIAHGEVMVNGSAAKLGLEITDSDTITLNGQVLRLAKKALTIIMNKPVGYVCSRNGQGSKTIYDLLPPELHNLKPVGRLDKDSSGLLLLTNDGQLAHELTHPSYNKQKVYEVTLDKPLAPQDREQITKSGVKLEDGLSKFELQWLDKNDGVKWVVTMHEGRNRQIRRTFAALGYGVIKLCRQQFGNYRLKGLKTSEYIMVTK